MKARTAALVVASAGGLALAYLRVLRPWYTNWGATAEEAARRMPLDERIPEPAAVTTRGITIHAGPEFIWPWIVQMGEPPRAGYYSYTWIERMQGLHIENADQVLPQYQILKVGDRLDRDGNMNVLDVDPGRHVVLGPPAGVDWLKCTWVIALYPLDDSSTRLVTRIRARVRLARMFGALPPAAWPFWLLIHPGVFIMERRMLLEIKRRAERLSEQAHRTGEARKIPL